MYKKKSKIDLFHFFFNNNIVMCYVSSLTLYTVFCFWVTGHCQLNGNRDQFQETARLALWFRDNSPF